MSAVSQALVEHENSGPVYDLEPLATALTPMTMIDRALVSGAPPETLERLLALQERWEANQGRKAFDEAMAAAKAEIPTIRKNRTVDFTSSKGRTHCVKGHELSGDNLWIAPKSGARRCKTCKAETHKKWADAKRILADKASA